MGEWGRRENELDNGSGLMGTAVARLKKMTSAGGYRIPRYVTHGTPQPFLFNCQSSLSPVPNRVELETFFN